MSAKRLFYKQKHLKEQEYLWFFSDIKNFHQNDRISRRNDRWLCADGPNEAPSCSKFPATVMVFGVVKGIEGHIIASQFSPQSPRVNEDADAYVGIVQTIVKPPWVNTVANGGRPCLSTRFGSISKSSQNPGLEGKEFLSSCHTELMTAS
ncbi:hypothetical protein ACTXT7_003916 [Hymenolepis weldensis]